MIKMNSTSFQMNCKAHVGKTKMTKCWIFKSSKKYENLTS